jgi:predicted MFS family arabinose efflux permease
LEEGLRALSGIIRTSTGEWKHFWRLPIAAALGYSTATLPTYGLGAFIQPLQDSFGWTRSEISAGLTITGFIGALLSIPVGIVVDRFGPRIVGLIGIVLMTATFALLGTASGTLSNWFFLWVLLALSNVAVQGTVWTKAVASRFERSRGLALAVTLSGGSLAATLLPLIATSLTSSFGWRASFMGVAAIWLIAVFPAVFVYFHGDRGGTAHRVSKTVSEAHPGGVTVAEIVRSPNFYRIIITCLCFAFIVNGIVVHFVPILTSGGADKLHAAAIASLIGVFSVVGRLSIGFLLDRLPSQLLGAAICLCPVVASLLLILDADNGAFQLIGAIMFGLTVGSEIDVIAYLTTRAFGLKAYGMIFGTMMGALSIGIALGPLAAGIAYDIFGSYSQFLGLTIAMMTLSALALGSLRIPATIGSVEP